MGKAKWWVCGECKSLNDKPANKCYNCRSPKPDNPTLMDDEYSEVGGGQQRVGITVDLSQVDLATPDPKETQRAGGIYEDIVPQTQQGGRYGAEDDQPLASSRADIEPAAPPPPLRDPAARSIAEAGGRHWLEDYTGLGPESDQPKTQGASPSAPVVSTLAPPPPGQPPPPPVAPGQPPPPPSQPTQPPPSGNVPPGPTTSQPPGPPPPSQGPGQVPPGAPPQGAPSMPPPPPGQAAPPGFARPPAPPPPAGRPRGTSGPPPGAAPPPGAPPPAQPATAPQAPPKDGQDPD